MWTHEKGVLGENDPKEKEKGTKCFYCEMATKKLRPQGESPGVLGAWSQGRVELATSDEL